MAGETPDGTPLADPTGLPQITEAFGFTMEAEVPPSVKLGVQQARDTLADLRGKISEHITNQWASAAVTADLLKGRIAHAINNTVSGAQTTLAQLQQPIATSVLSQLSSAAERAAGLGVVLPIPNQPAVAPACVQIREGGLAGDIGPALEAYRAMAFEQRFTRGQGYVDTIQFITACLPENGPTRELFASNVLQLQNLPDNAVLQATVTPADATAEVQALHTTTAPCAAPPHPGWVCRPPGYFRGVNQALWAPPQLLRGSGPAPGLVPCQWPPPPCAVAGGAPGNGTVTMEQSLQSGGNLGQTIGTGGATGGAGGSGGNIQITAGILPSCGELAAAGWPDAAQLYPAGQYTGQAGEQFSLGYEQNADGSALASIICTNCQPGFGPPPQTCNIPGTGGGGNGNIGIGNGTGNGTIGNGTCPPPPTCQPVTVKVECGTTCGNQTTGNQPPPPPADICAWQRAETGICYVNFKDTGPINSADKQLVCGPFGITTINQIIAACCGNQTQSTQTQGSGGGGAVGPFTGGCIDFPPTPIAADINVATEFLQWIGLQDSAGNTVVPFPNAGVLDIGQNIVNGLWGAISTQFNQILTALGQFLAQTGCADGQQIGLIATGELIGTMEKWLGWDLSQLRIPNAYQRQFRCPVTLPTPTEAGLAWLGNEISDDTLTCWLRANNAMSEEAKTWIRSQRQKLSPLQYAVLYKRGYLSAEDFQLRIRSAGMIQPTDPKDLLDSLQQIPPPGDVIRMMVRDSADEALAAKFQLDLEFDQKFAGQLRDWAEQQGIPELYMQWLWRAHWAIPAPTQLMEMLHRNSRLPPGDPAYVDVDIIKAALAQQDIAPFWRDKFIAISYRPLTRIDAARAYQIGALKYDELVNAYLDLGYNPDNAGRLANFQSRKADLSFQRHWSVKEYAAGSITFTEFTQALQTDGATDNAVQLATDRAETLLRAGSRRACARALRKRYLLGDLPLSDVQQKLNGLGLAADQVQTLTAGWQCELDARGRNLPAGELCGLYEIGALTVPDLTMRLQRLGYSYDDSVLIARRCVTRVNDKISRQEAADLRRQEADFIRSQNQLQKQANQAARASKQAQQAALKAQNLKVLREKRIIEAGEKLSKHWVGSLADAIIAAKAAYHAFLNTSAYLQDEIISALLVVSGSREVTTLNDLTLAMQTALTDTGAVAPAPVNPGA